MNDQMVIAEDDAVEEFRRENQTKEIWRRFKKSKGSLVGLFLLVIILLLVIFANFITSYDLAIKQDPSKILEAPSMEHPFGCDNYGRDVLARTIHGGRISLGIAVLATLCSCVVGSLLGAVAGYFGGVIDSVIMRTLDIFMSVPDILFTMAIVVAFGSSFTVLLLALTVAFFTNYVRLVRSQVLNLSEQDYIEASRAGGAGNARIIFSHILPNSIGVIIVNVTLNVAKIIIYESTLSFLGLGMPPPQPDWGLMLSEAREFMRKAPFLMFFPGTAIVLCAVAVNFIGDGLRDALDPHLKS
ncbi:MAG: ABC transporter permease [Synergistaceae bacterium]|jgi:peptide/nickel transport system permease protein|nr:ABC transporter permease [Synergistaceae bacterium]